MNFIALNQHLLPKHLQIGGGQEGLDIQSCTNVKVKRIKYCFLLTKAKYF